ncbi:MAG: hypothetical protein GX267_17930 [Fibrobacter sp.]|nr:hypothetical protein [Fibrobacter sp.]
MIKLIAVTLFFLTLSKTYADMDSFDFIRAGDTVDTYWYKSEKGKLFTAELPKKRSPSDYTPLGFVKQPSFVRGGGVLNKNERSLLLYADGDLLPPAIMLSYSYGLLYWWDIGIDIGGNSGVFQSLIRTRMENFKTRKTERFFWSNQISAGFKHHEMDFSDDLQFDDRSLVGIIDNSLGLRFGPMKRKVLYLLTIFYVDYDIHTPRRQTDYYLIPAVAGFEAMIGEHASFFVESGAVYSITGMQMADNRVLYEKDWFPTLKIGVAWRSGGKTAIYYTRETKPLSRGKQPKEVR